jgi:hypothetical protein
MAGLMLRIPMAKIAVLNLLAEMALAQVPLPRQWSRSLFAKPPYRAGVDSTVCYESQPSLFIDGIFSPPTPVGPGVFTAKFSVVSGVRQAIKADRYRGRKVRWSAYLRTEHAGSVWNDDPPGATRIEAVKDTSPGAGLYVMIDSREDTLLYAMTKDRLVGTNNWTRLDMIFDVPLQSALVTIGVFLSGQGKLWATAFAFEEVSPSLPTTFDLNLTRTQIYDYTFAWHKKRLKEYARAPDAPILGIQVGHRVKPDCTLPR